MRLFPRLRLLLARRPWLYWLVVGLCAAVVWLSVSAAADGVAAERARWGTTQRVWVAAAPVAAGSPVVAVARDYPQAMVPPSALTAEPSGVAAHELAADEVVVEGDVVSADDGLAPTDWLVFAVPVEAAPQVASGDTVAIFGSGQWWCDGVVAGASDSAVDGRVVELAVPPDCAPSLSAQLALGAVTLARAP
ncbi:MAG: hypothetical protein ABMA25_15230 [Ilumatobacteraceae bacterium]